MSWIRNLRWIAPVSLVGVIMIMYGAGVVMAASAQELTDNTITDAPGYNAGIVWE